MKRTTKADAERIAREWVNWPNEYTFLCVKKENGEWWVYYTDRDKMRRTKPLAKILGTAS